MENITDKAAQAHAFFLTHGYAVVKNIVPPSTIANVHAFLLNQTNDALGLAQKELRCDSASGLIDVAGEIAEGKYGTLSALTKATRDTLTGHFPLNVRLSEKLWQIPMSPEVREVLKACLNSKNIFMHMPPTARFVLSKNKHAGVPPHQDISYNGHMSSFITMWVPLVDITDECGGVIVYEGSGQSNVQEAPDSQQQYWRKPIETLDYKPRHMTIKAGDILLLNQNIVHGSALNSSDQTRISIDFRIFGEQDSSTKHYLDLQTMHIFEPKISVL
ncbi:phytanoyl-CoA dioxygenase [Oxalobacteraceae bacterium CAVE-383]|nr:phytanoyl-CoA dioxygenase [Oxalobacteraceae bacterium CAVE-383]